VTDQGSQSAISSPLSGSGKAVTMPTLVAFRVQAPGRLGIPMSGSSARRWKPIRVCAPRVWSKCFAIVVTEEVPGIYAVW
jgi:hypothetical protein